MRHFYAKVYTQMSYTAVKNSDFAIIFKKNPQNRSTT